MTTAEALPSGRPPLLDRLHDILLLLLPAMRPWCWDGAYGQPAELVWQGLAGFALLLVAGEAAAGLRTWRWSWRGALAVATLLALLPAVAASPEPSPAWCRWSGWLACLAAAAYAMQVLPGRQRLAIAGLGAGLAITALFGVAQTLWVLPAMAAAQQAGSTVFAGMPGDPAAISERIANGGAYATFTLANQFGAYLALLIPLFAGTAWATWRRDQRPAPSAQRPAVSSQRPAAILTAAGLVLLALAALACAGAKGAWLALASGGALAWWLALRGSWWRWLPLPLGLAGLLVLLRSGLADASIAVREQYWRSAITLAQEGGLGLGGFAAHQPRVMQVGEEPTRYAHNEVLEAAVAGGWWLGGVVLCALVALAWPRRSASEPAPAAEPPRGLAVALVVMVPYLAVLRAFDGNLGWWPGGESVVLVWAVLLGGIAGATALALWRAEPPPAWAWAAGLAAVALKALIDFDCHAGGVLGSALLVAACAGAPSRQTVGGLGRWLPLPAALLCAVLLGTGMASGLRLADAEAWLAQARQVGDAESARQLAERLGLDPALPPAALAAAAGERAWLLAEGAPGTRLAALDLMPPGQATLDRAAELTASAPASAAAGLRHALLLMLGRRWRDAAAEAERAVGLAPTAPRVLAMAADVLERVGEAQPGARQRAEALRAEAARLRPLVHSAVRGP